KNTASKPPHRYVAAVPSAAVAALNSDSRSNETTSAVGIKKAPRAGREKAAFGRPRSCAIARYYCDTRVALVTLARSQQSRLSPTPTGLTRLRLSRRSRTQL